MINIDYCFNNSFSVYASNEEMRVSTPVRNMSLNQAVDIARGLIIRHNFVRADVVDGTTGEVFVTLEKEEESDYFDDVDESAYNPFLGCDFWD